MGADQHGTTRVSYRPVLERKGHTLTCTLPAVLLTFQPQRVARVDELIEAIRLALKEIDNRVKTGLRAFHACFTVLQTFEIIIHFVDVVGCRRFVAPDVAQRTLAICRIFDVTLKGLGSSS